ncbi:hypothetical protein TYRP_009758 [Tyrophagus putrescentiae]|nr:hypothetical protein TYRP_009758 [Tyrophagus putrescentiae]
MSESHNLLKLIGPSNVAALLRMKAPLHHANRQVRPVLDDKVASDQPLGGRLREGYAHPGLRRPVHAIHAQLSVHQLAGGHLRQAVQARPVLVHGDGHPVDEEVHLHVDDHIGRQFDHLAEVDIAQRHAVGAVHAQQADAVVDEEQHLLVARPGQRQHVLDGLLRLEQTEADHSLPVPCPATATVHSERLKLASSSSTFTGSGDGNTTGSTSSTVDLIVLILCRCAACLCEHLHLLGKRQLLGDLVAGQRRLTGIGGRQSSGCLDSLPRVIVDLLRADDARGVAAADVLGVPLLVVAVRRQHVTGGSVILGSRSRRRGVGAACLVTLAALAAVASDDQGLFDVLQ